MDLGHAGVARLAHEPNSTSIGRSAVLAHIMCTLALRNVLPKCTNGLTLLSWAQMCVPVPYSYKILFIEKIWFVITISLILLGLSVLGLGPLGSSGFWGCSSQSQRQLLQTGSEGIHSVPCCSGCRWVQGDGGMIPQSGIWRWASMPVGILSPCVPVQ